MTDASSTPTTSQQSLRRQLDILAEMVEALDTQTDAGRRHTMGKVIAVLTPQVRLQGTAFTDRGQRGIERTVAWLAAEARRPLPSAPVFRRGAELVISLLASTAS